MLRYIAIIWDANAAEKIYFLNKLRERHSSLKAWQTVVDQPGLIIWYTSSDSSYSQAYRLANSAGAILGTLFRDDSVVGSSYVDELDEKSSCAISCSKGRFLIEQFWGRYVAFIHSPELQETSVLRDPLGGISCFVGIVDGARFYFSDISDFVALGLLKISIDWSFIAAQLAVTVHHTERTGLVEVRELLGGHRDRVLAAKVQTECLWDPVNIALTDAIEDPIAAARELRQVAQNCINAWASRHKRIFHLLSGGIDSSIVLACLSAAPTQPSITCLTQFSESLLGGDERSFAKLAADAAGCRWLTQADNLGGSLAVAFEIAKTVRPRLYIGCLNERQIVQRAIEHNADAIYTGELGDGLFYEQRGYSATDYLWTHGADRKWLEIARSAAKLERISVWRVLRNAVCSLHESRYDPIGTATRGNPPLLSPKGAATARDLASSLLSPWLRDRQRIPLGKQAHISMLACSLASDMPLRQPGDPEQIAVLASQPLLQLCLRMPTYILTNGARTRAIARQAFARDVPASILGRIDKGNTSRATAMILRNNAKIVRASLEDGILVNEGLLSRSDIVSALSGPSSISPTTTLIYFSTEAWLRGWIDSCSPSTAYE